MANRIYYYAEALSRTTTTTTDYSVVKVTLNFTPNANKDYVILWNILIDQSPSGTYYGKARLYNSTASAVLCECSTTTQTTAVKNSFGGVSIYSAGASPVQQTMQIQVASSNASGTLGAQEACIFIMELGADDKFAQSLSGTGSTSASYVAKVTLSFTPPSAGDYLIVGSNTEAASAASTWAQTRLWDGTTAYSAHTSLEGRDATEIQPAYYMARPTGISAAQTWSIDNARAGGAGTVTMSNATLVALRMSGFDNYYWGESRTDSNSTSATYADKISVGPNTPKALGHLIIATGQQRFSTGNYGTVGGNKATGGGVDVGSLFYQIICGSGTRASWLSLRKRTEAASSTTWKTQSNRVSGADTAIAFEHVLAIMQLDSETMPYRRDPMRTLLTM